MDCALLLGIYLHCLHRLLSIRGLRRRPPSLSGFPSLGCTCVDNFGSQQAFDFESFVPRRCGGGGGEVQNAPEQ